ncbi:MAG: IucA/IucC family protein [Acidimicrobiales bacterium]
MSATLAPTPTETAGVSPLAAATAAASEALVNCYLRESEDWRFVGGNVVIPLAACGADVVVELRYRSPTFRHRYRWPARLVLGARESALSFPALAGLLIDELGTGHGSHSGGRRAPAGEAPTELLGRMLDSLHAVAGFLDQRRDAVDRLWSPEPLGFIASEQALLLGHPLHPTPKSRGEMSARERAAYSPETQGRFPLRWLAAHPDVVRHASATGRPAPEEAAAILRNDPATDVRALNQTLATLGPRVLLPTHPWELAYLRSQPELASLFADDGLVDLGPLGSPVTPTTSVRTVYQPDWAWQLKFSLHVRVTNSMRVTLPKELDRAVEAARLAQTPVGEAARRVAPAFRCIHDPAYLTVAHDGTVIDGFSVLLRESPWPGGSTADVTAVATLCQDHPFSGGPSRLAGIVARQAARDGCSPADAGRAWFARFCDVAVGSLVRLYLDLGLCFEPHQQNTLLELDTAGWPERCYYRDSQGYFHREAAHADVAAVIPGLGEATESIFPEALADERLVYYPFLNLTLGVVNALGAAGCGDEEVLLGDLRRCLEAERATGGRYPATLLDRLLDDERWPCKANLRTRFHDLDELVGDIETQSVYVTVPNPLVPWRAAQPATSPGQRERSPMLPDAAVATSPGGGLT